ncbi:MAG: hypothetical protein MJZ76_06445 [Bacteroidales bacterium]|nr:hypothetical protein [Bacteroidales bacterium]
MKTLRVAMIIGTLILSAAMISGCSGDNSNGTKGPSSVSQGETKTTDSTKPSKTTTTKAPVKPEVSITETVLLDENGVKITAKGMNKGLFGPSIKLLLENNTDKSLTVQTRKSSVNGYMVETMFSADVAAGKKANEELVFMQSDLKSAGISDIADMEFAFHVFDSNSWTTYLDTDLISIKTSVADGFVYSFDNSGQTAYTGNGFEIVIKGISEDSILGTGVVVYIDNTSAEDICVQVRDVSVNGFMIDPFFSEDVSAGKHSIGTITILSSDLQKNDITKIEDIELSFHIFNESTWRDIVNTDAVKITFNK